jgi:hypothetical protein
LRKALGARVLAAGKRKSPASRRGYVLLPEGSRDYRSYLASRSIPAMVTSTTFSARPVSRASRSCATKPSGVVATVSIMVNQRGRAVIEIASLLDKSHLRKQALDSALIQVRPRLVFGIGMRGSKIL